MSDDEPDFTPARNGAALAREALARAKSGKSAIAANSKTTAAHRRRIAGDRARSAGWTAPGPDERDPQSFGATIGDLVDGRGWEQTTKVATVLACWEAIVGAAIAEHCQPEAVKDGELVLAAESTSWATQLQAARADDHRPDRRAARARALLSPYACTVRPVPAGGTVRAAWPAAGRATPTAEP